MIGDATIGAFSVVVAIAAIWLDHRARKREAVRLETEKTRDEARMAREKGQFEQQRKEAQSLEDSRYLHDQRVQAMGRLTDWAQRVTVELSYADHVMNCPLVQREKTHSNKERVEVAARISALIDEGRWLFRNHHPERFGQKKAKLNQGYRDNRLDALVVSYTKLLSADAVDPMAARKDFTFKVQQLSIPLSEQVLKEEEECLH